MYFNRVLDMFLLKIWVAVVVVWKVRVVLVVDVVFIIDLEEYEAWVTGEGGRK